MINNEQEYAKNCVKLEELKTKLKELNDEKKQIMEQLEIDSYHEHRLKELLIEYETGTVTLESYLRKTVPYMDLVFTYAELVAMIDEGKTEDKNEEGFLYKYDEEQYESLLNKYNEVKKLYNISKNNLSKHKEGIESIGNVLNRMKELDENE